MLGPGTLREAVFFASQEQRRFEPSVEKAPGFAILHLEDFSRLIFA